MKTDQTTIIIFSVNVLSHQFDEEFNNLGEKTEKYESFSVPKNKGSCNKNGSENLTTISYKIKLIDNARFMSHLLSNAADNLA